MLIKPGSTIGILGGGQLGRMLVLAAVRLGYQCHVFCEDPLSPAIQVTNTVTLAPFDDQEALYHFTKTVDVVTVEWENIPLECLQSIEHKVPLYPSSEILRIVQDRILEKHTIQQYGHAVVPWYPVYNESDLRDALNHLGYPVILKTARFGYDGKGQHRIDKPTDAPTAWHSIAMQPSLIEQVVGLRRELSVIVCRARDGEQAAYTVVENLHQHHILVQTIIPAPIPKPVAQRAQQIAHKLAQELHLVGLLAVEFFETHDGTLFVNELAARPHNSGHWTIDMCTTSQFEQLVRAICGLPLGNTKRFTDGVMSNLLGEEILKFPLLLAEKNSFVHLYGKQHIHPQRKMGHVTRITSS